MSSFVRRHGLRLALPFALVLCLMAVLAVFAAEPTAPAVAKEKTAEEVYKNIKSMKGQPASQVIPQMVFMSNSLGVGCEFCHEHDAFDKDTKDEKRTAREMITMQAELNRTHFKGKREVTCNSCHNGHGHPAAAPALPELEAAIPEAVEHHGGPAAPKLASPTEYLDEFYRAIGGDAATKLHSRSLKGTVAFGGYPPAAYESYTRATGERTTVITLPNGAATSAFDGHTGWLAYPGRHARTMSPGEKEATRVEADLEFPANLKSRYTQFHPGRPETIGGHTMNVLTATRQGEPGVRLYFDAETHLLTRAAYAVETPLGRNPVRVDFVGWVVQDGVKLPSEWIVTRPDSRARYQITTSDGRSTIDDSRFTRPAEPVEAAKH